MKTDINILLDISGSMNSIKSDTIGGFNQFLQTQKELPDEAVVTLVQFDDQYDLIYSAVPIQQVVDLTEETFVPRGWTALLDALGKLIDTTGIRLRDMPENDRPSKVIFVIITDGEENKSKIFSKDKIFSMIKHQKDVYSWDFVFIGANQDVIASGADIGISSNNTLGFTADSRGVHDAYTTLSRSMSSYRSSTTKGDFFNA